MVNTLQRLILVDEGSKGQLPDIVGKLAIRQRHAAVLNLLSLGRHLVRAQHYRDLRMSAFAEWRRAVA